MYLLLAVVLLVSIGREANPEHRPGWVRYFVENAGWVLKMGQKWPKMAKKGPKRAKNGQKWQKSQFFRPFLGKNIANPRL